MKISRELPIEYSHDVHVSENESFDQVVLLLHGFQLDGKFMFKRFEKKFGARTKIIAPNAPFLVPLKKEKDWVPRYSWYFYHAQKKNFYINYEPAAKWVTKLMEQLNPEKKELAIMGYSQGGYLAPKVAELLEETVQVVGINSIFRSERFKIKENVRYDQVQGALDTIVSPVEAKAEFLAMRKAGAHGEFRQVEEEHLLNQRLVQAALDLAHFPTL
ncbi:MAG: hypothetical protein WEB87_06130 [Bacteriovoracaceae bacterium]